MSPHIFIPQTEREQVALLNSMYTAQPQYDERLRSAATTAPSPRVTELAREPLIRAWFLPGSAEAQLLHLRRQHSRMQREVCRGLKILGCTLGILAVGSACQHFGSMAAALTLLALTCVPLYMLATPTGPEWRS